MTTPNLKSFIARALTEIAHGVRDAAFDTRKIPHQWTSPGAGRMTDVKFELAITYGTNAEAKDGFDVQVLKVATAIGEDAVVPLPPESISRVSFAVPVDFGVFEDKV